MLRRRSIRFEPCHMENVGDRIEIMARGEARQFVGERGYVESNAGRCISAATITYSHQLSAAPTNIRKLERQIYHSVQIYSEETQPQGARCRGKFGGLIVT
jgi:hypothetical protein